MIENTPEEIYQNFLEGKYGRAMPYSKLFDYYKVRKKEGCCAFCSKPIVNKKRTVWCSDECINQVTKNVQGWSQIRAKIIQRDNSVCQICKQHTNNPEVDHDVPFALDPSKHTEESNLRVLCNKCHKKKTRQDLVKIRSGKIRVSEWAAFR